MKGVILTVGYNILMLNCLSTEAQGIICCCYYAIEGLSIFSLISDRYISVGIIINAVQPTSSRLSNRSQEHFDYSPEEKTYTEQELQSESCCQVTDDLASSQSNLNRMKLGLSTYPRENANAQKKSKGGQKCMKQPSTKSVNDIKNF